MTIFLMLQFLSPWQFVTTNLYLIFSAFSPPFLTLLPSGNQEFFYIYEYISVFFINLFCSLDSTYGWNHMLLGSDLFHLAHTSMLYQMVKFHSLSWPSNIVLLLGHKYISHVLYSIVYWWTLRLLPYLHILTVVNNAAINIGLNISFWITLLDVFG